MLETTITPEETHKALNRFLLDVVKKSKKNLDTQGINASRSLKKSLKKTIKVSPNSFTASISAEDYLPFIDRGVKGVKGGKSLGDISTKKPYAYTNKMPPVRFLQTWIKQKSGKFRQMNQRQMAFAVQRKVFNYGIKPTKFFTNPFEQEFANLPDELIEAYGLDVDKFMEFLLKE
jgi:hypothetical protein